MSHYEHPSDEGWIPNNIQYLGRAYRLTQLIRIECLECGADITVPKRNYKASITSHHMEHEADDA